MRPATCNSPAFANSCLPPFSPFSPFSPLTPTTAMQFTRLFTLLAAAAAFGATAALPAQPKVHELRLSNTTSTDAAKRSADYSGQFTYFYEDGSEGACGGVNGNNEYVSCLHVRFIVQYIDVRHNRSLRSTAMYDDFYHSQTNFQY